MTTNFIEKISVLVTSPKLYFKFYILIKKGVHCFCNDEKGSIFIPVVSVTFIFLLDIILLLFDVNI